MEQKHSAPIEGLEIRYTIPEDATHLKEWLSDPSVERWFPMCDAAEIDDAVARWISFSRYHCSLTALLKGMPCGLSTLYLQPYRKLAHQCEFGIIVGHGYRNHGIGSVLLSSLIRLAKERFHIELLHLQAYARNPAMRLYERFGFREFGRQTHWIKSVITEGEHAGETEYVGRVFMERWI